MWAKGSTRSSSPESQSYDDPSLWKPVDGAGGMVVVSVESEEESWTRLPDSTPKFIYRSYESLHRELTPKRVEIFRVMAGEGPMSIREVARRVGRDFKGVHTDVTRLVREGYLKKTEEGQVIFPYDGLRIAFGSGPSSAAA